MLRILLCFLAACKADRSALLLVFALFFIGNAMGTPQTGNAMNLSDAARQYAEVQARTGSGWNTWNTAGVMSHVLLPEGLGVSLGVKSSHRNDWFLYHAFKAQQGHRPESVKLGLRSDDGYYTELNVKWQKVSFDVQSATDGDDLLLLVSVRKEDSSAVYNLFVEGGMMWGRPGKVWRDGDALHAETGVKTRTIGCTAGLVDEPYMPTPMVYLATPLKGQVGFYTGKARSLDEIKAVMAAHRRQVERRHAAHGDNAELFAAMQTVLAWNVLYEPGNRRVISPISRCWNHSRANSYILYCWDTYFAATMYSYFNKDLAYVNAVEITRSRSVRGFVPNGAGAYNYRSDDRSQPPVGSLTINGLYKKFGERWLLELTYDDLLTWNRWWPKERQEQGYLCWGSNKVEPPLGRVMAYASKDAANCESGLDNSPMFDAAIYDPASGLLRQADVGLMSFYIRDCLELAEIARALGKTDDEQELRERARRYGKQLQTLWNEDAGIFLNKRLDTGKPNPRISPTNFYPMLARVATQAQAERMMRDHYFNPQVFHGEFVIPSCPRNDPAFADQNYWRGRIWAPMNYLVYLGLREYDLPEARKDLVERSRNLLLKGWREKGVVGENYNGKDGGYEDKSNCDNFYHWGALLGYISLIESQDRPVDEQIKSLISQMTLEEKVRMCHSASVFASGGVPRLGIPDLRMSDGPHGVRPDFDPFGNWQRELNAKSHSTYFPTGTAQAAAWDRQLQYEFGQAHGSEARARGKDIILSPMVNIQRTPLSGRTFEAFSEDPYLNAEMALASIRGIQTQDVAANIKAFAANNQEHERFSVNVEMDDRALHEIYLPAFKKAITKGNVLSIMGAYNKLRGHFCCHHPYLVDELLRKEWGYEGVLISDWGGVHDTEQAALYGVDIEMGTEFKQDLIYQKSFLGEPFLKRIQSGQLSEETVNKKVARILNLMFKINLFSPDRKQGVNNTKEHHLLAQKMAEDSMVLLKNDRQILPLDKTRLKTLAVIGPNADAKHAFGGGSSEIYPEYEVTPLEGLRAKLGDNVKILYSPAGTDQAIEYAKQSDIVLFIGGLSHKYDSECQDKPDLALPDGQAEMIHAIAKANPDTVVILVSGSVVEMSAWKDQVPAILQAWYAGQRGGHALANLLFGDVNPSGKLPMTFVKKLQDHPAHRMGEYPGKGTVHYKEGIYVGYRGLDKDSIEPEFCFGHGLSYTTFKYSGLKITKKDKERATVSCNLTNTGSCEGKEVVQLYVSDKECSVDRPVKELKGFEKVSLKPGETKAVVFQLDEEAFSFYSPEKKGWIIEPGEFEILLGSSSRDIRLTGRTEIE